MSNKQIIYVVIAVAIAGSLVAYFVSRKGSSAPESELSQQGGQGLVTREVAPENIAVPEKDSGNVPENVAKPEQVSPAAAGVEEDMRTFSITVSGNKFSPDTVIARVGDIIKLNFTAVDKNYEFTQPDYGFKAQLPKGQTVSVTFGVNGEGKFLFYCGSCGGPSQGPVGYIIVVKR
mgnify:CR=1 FL=1